MKTTKLTHVTVAAGMLAVLTAIHPAAAQSSDALLNKLVEKGILTAKEAGDLKEEDKKTAPKNFASTTCQSRTGAVMSGSIVPSLNSSENRRIVIRGKIRTNANQKKTELKNAS